LVLLYEDGNYLNDSRRSEGKHAAERVTHFTHSAKRPTVTSTNSQLGIRVLAVLASLRSATRAQFRRNIAHMLYRPSVVKFCVDSRNKVLI
jgi:hypothetical protein